MRHLLIVSVALSVLVGCGGRQNPPPADGGTGNDLSAEERDVVDRGGDSSNATQQLTVLADSLFDFDPTIDTAKTAAENAAAVERRVRANLGDTDGGVPPDGGATRCGTVSVSAVPDAGATVTVAFGPAPGCTLFSGPRVSGTVSVNVTKVASTITLALTLTQVVVNGVSMNGTASFATTNGSNFTVNANFTSGTKTYVVTNLSVAGGTGTATINGSVSVAVGDAVTTITFNMLTWRAVDCYPNGGTITSRKGLITTTVAFDLNTATTGIVHVTTGRKTIDVPLPVYGSCGVKDGGP